MKTKAKTAAELAENRLVFDRPFVLQEYDLTRHIWAESLHLHASINRSVSTAGRNPADSGHTERYLFRVRYFAALEAVRRNLSGFRVCYAGNTYELSGHDDYSERRRIIKLTAEKIRTGTVTLISCTEETDSIGQIVPAETQTVLPCTEYEVTQEEQTAAHQTSLWFAFRLRIFRSEYSGEALAEYQGKRYAVGAVRYAGDNADLYLAEKVGELNGRTDGTNHRGNAEIQL